MPGWCDGLVATPIGGSGEYSFAVTSGTLPPGLNLSTPGVISGTPSAAGAYSFTVTATDNLGYTASQEYAITVS